jgi:DNA polymerase I
MYGGVEFRDYPDPENIGRLDHGCLPLIHSMQHHGIRVDIPLLQSISSDIRTRQSTIVNEVLNQIGDYQYTKTQKKTTKARGVHFIQVREPFKIGSPDHVAQLLFHHLRAQGDAIIELVPSRTRESTSDDILEPFAKHPVVASILEWRELDKIRGTYAEPLQTMADSDSRIHTKFNPTVASTGRLSSSAPNLQNIPVRSEDGKRIRQAFIPRPGCVLVSNDLSQIEMRWAAHGSADPTMVEVFFRGEDIHTKTACGIFDRDYAWVTSQEEANPAWYKKWRAEERAPSKNLGFGVLYGLTPPGLKRNIFNESGGKVDWTEEKCAGFIDKFFTVYPGLRDLIDTQYRRAQRWAMVWDAFGRPRLVPEGRSSNTKVRNEGLRKAGNHYEQSSAQGTIKLAMAELVPVYEDMHKSFTCVPLLQIHDELISEVDKYYAREVAAEISGVMSKASPLIVPVESSSDYGETWRDLK